MKRRMVMALHLEDGGLAVADIDDAGVLARPADHPGCGGGQRLQPLLRGFVGAVLAPHHREDAKLGQIRRAAENRQNPRVFLSRQAVAGDDIGGDRRGLGVQFNASIKASNIARPSVRPVAGSKARSGWGIRPSTLPAFIEHAGDVARRAVGIGGFRHGTLVVAIAEGDMAGIFEGVEGGVVGEIIAVAVGDRHPDGLAFLVMRRERAFGGFDLEADFAADELQIAVRQERSGQQLRFGQDLKAVADAEHGDALLGPRRRLRASPANAPPSRRSAGSRRRKTRRAAR